MLCCTIDIVVLALDAAVPCTTSFDVAHVLIATARGVATGVWGGDNSGENSGKFGETKGCFWLLVHPIKFGQFYKNSIFGR